MENFEKLGVFYLGKEYDLKAKKAKDDLILYDSKDLVTHAVCVGMTGSGKTGLCLGLIEEAAMDNVPAILVDPKGDLSNLLLTFPQLRPEDFRPWINEDDARQKGLTSDEYAAQQSQLWTKGLADWGQDGARIQQLRNAVDFRIYTPGSKAGFQVSILKSFSAPGPAILEDAELLNDRINTTVTSLLSLTGIQGDPIKSREHILLSKVIENQWTQGHDLDLEELIQQVQRPSMDKIGVLDLESFYPEKERFELVMALNNLIASPGFSLWLEGEPLDISQILYTPQGKPRIAIFSIAHLGDAERMFFTSLLLNQILGWVRTQSGTNSLRAIFYMDEIFGYLPPTANPPAKKPMLTLLKQARAFGLGLVLATQNPVDLDYKALSNCGTWFIGRLQTDRDKTRLLDGLEGATASTGGKFDKQKMEQTIAGLGNRVFLMNNVHDDEPIIFTTRWVMSYLRGPLTRDQIKILMDPVKSTARPVGGNASGASSAVADRSVTRNSNTARTLSLPAEIPSYFAPVRGRVPAGGELVYQPTLVGAAKVHFTDIKSKLDQFQLMAYSTPVTDDPIPVDWAEAVEFPVDINDMEKSPQPQASLGALPNVALRKASYDGWEREFTTWLYGTAKLEVFRSPSLKVLSQPGEEEAAFRLRLSQSARETRDDAVEALRKKYASRITTLKERLRRAQQAVQREKDQARDKGFQSAISIGSSILGALTSRRISATRVTTAARGVGRSLNEQGDIKRANETVEAVEKQLADLQAEFDAEKSDLQQKMDPQMEEFERVSIKPKKTDIIIQLVSLAWLPYFRDSAGKETQAF